METTSAVRTWMPDQTRASTASWAGTARRLGVAAVARREVVLKRPVRRVVPNSDGDHVGGAEVDARPDSSVYGQLVEDRLAVPVPQSLRRRNQVEVHPSGHLDQAGG